MSLRSIFVMVVMARGLNAEAPPATSGEPPEAARPVAPELLRRHIENLASRESAIRRQAAKALIEIGEAAVSSLERTLASDPRRADLAKDILDEIVWGVDLRQREEPRRPPDPELLDVGVLKEIGFPDTAASNPLLVDALTIKVREHDETLHLPTGQAPPLRAALNALDQLRATEVVPYDELEQKGEILTKQFPSPEEQGRIYAMVAHVYGQSGCRPRTVSWARRALRYPIPPELRLRMYEYWYSATLLQYKTAALRSTPEARRDIVRPALFGLKEAMRYDLPSEVTELPMIELVRENDAQSRALQRRQVQARIAAEFAREMIQFREIHLSRVLEQCAGSAGQREELSRLLATPGALDSLTDALRAGEDLKGGAAIVKRREASGR